MRIKTLNVPPQDNELWQDLSDCQSEEVRGGSSQLRAFTNRLQKIQSGADNSASATSSGTVMTMPTWSIGYADVVRPYG